MLTIKPGLLFSLATVGYFISQGLTDDDVAALIAIVEDPYEATPRELAHEWVMDGMPYDAARDIIMASTVGGAL